MKAWSVAVRWYPCQKVGPSQGTKASASLGHPRHALTGYLLRAHSVLGSETHIHVHFPLGFCSSDAGRIIVLKDLWGWGTQNSP